MPDYAALKAEISKPSYDGLSDEQIAAELNAANIAVPADIGVGDVEGYLRLNARITGLEDWIAANPNPSVARTAARELLGILSGKVTVLSTGTPTTRAVLQGMFAAIVSAGAGGVTQADSDALFGMAQRNVSWAQQNGWPTIGPGDVANARAL